MIQVVNGLVTGQEILHALIALLSYKANYQLESSGVRPMDMQLLERIPPDEGTPTLELARRCGIPPATAVAILDRLQAAGLVRRVRHVTDRRVVEVSLTADGRRLLDRHLEEDRAFWDNFLAPLTEDEGRQLQALLAKALLAVDPRSLFATAPKPAKAQEQ